MARDRRRHRRTRWSQASPSVPANAPLPVSPTISVLSVRRPVCHSLPVTPFPDSSRRAVRRFAPDRTRSAWSLPSTSNPSARALPRPPRLTYPRGGLPPAVAAPPLDPTTYRRYRAGRLRSSESRRACLDADDRRALDRPRRRDGRRSVARSLPRVSPGQRRFRPIALERPPGRRPRGALSLLLAGRDRWRPSPTRFARRAVGAVTAE